MKDGDVLFPYPDRSGETALLSFWCPGCKREHPFRIKPEDGYSVWSFDGNMKRPTFSPSLLIHARANDGAMCHLFVRGGQIEFCSDSQHELAGKTVPMVRWSESLNDWECEPR